MESLYLYGRALLPLLPTAPGEALPQITESVLLTHLRTEAQGEEQNLALASGSDIPGVALPGGGTGAAYQSPVEKLSALIEALNERYGMNLGEADLVWFNQLNVVVTTDPHMQVVALHNDQENYTVELAKFLDDAVVDRNEANGELFNAFFEKPGFRDAILKYLAATYGEIRDKHAS